MNMKKKMAFWVGSLLMLAFFGLVQSAGAVTISPPSQEFSGDPGQMIDGKIKLYNETKGDLELYSSVLDFGAKEGEGGEPQFFEMKKDEDAGSNKMSGWIDITKDRVVVKPGEWKTIDFKINVPKNAEPGGHYAAVFFGPTPDGQEMSKAQVGVNYNAGSLLLLNVSGDAQQKGAVKDFKVKDKPKFKNIFRFVPVPMEARIENQGNVHFKPSGNVEIKNMLGKKVAEIPVLKSNVGGNILPHSVRKFDIVWGQELEGQKAEGFFARAKYEWKNLRIGKYTAELTVALPKGETGKMATSFWVIPIELLIIIFVGLAVFYILIKQYNKWIAQGAQKGEKKKKE